MRILIALIILFVFSVPVLASQGSTGNGTSPIICDATVSRCGNVVTMPNGLSAPLTASFVNSSGSVQAVACDKSVPINITTATTTEIILVSGSKSIYICAFYNSKTSGAGSTWQIEYGTKTTTACDTGATTLTPAIDGNAVVEQMGNGMGTILTVPASKELCIVTVGGGSSFIGFIVYAQF